MAIFAGDMDGNSIDIFNLGGAEAQAVPGSVLVAKPGVDDPVFSRSVIQLAHSDEDGGILGVIVNKALPVSLNRIVPELAGVEAEIPLFLGGPMDTETLFYLHTLGPEAVPRCVEVRPGLFFGGDFEAVIQYILSGGATGGRIKFMAGYSGWHRDQLRQEVERHSWAVVNDAATDLLMNCEPSAMWNEAVRRMGRRYEMWRLWPEDVSLN